jgi:hypothetical protein
MWFLVGHMPWQRSGLGPPADLLSSAGVPDRKKVGKELLPTSPSLRYGATCAVNLLCCAAKLTARLQHSVQTGCRSLSTMRLHSAVQPPAQEAAVAGVGTRGNTGCGIASFTFDSCLRLLNKRCSQFAHNSRRPPVLPPVCQRLRHAVRAAGIGTAECQCIVFKFAATCLSGARSAKRVLPHRRPNGVTQVCP